MGFHEFILPFEYSSSTMSDFKVEISNSLIGDVSELSIGFGDMALELCTTGVDFTSNACCHDSCTDGCTGPTEDDCTVKTWDEYWTGLDCDTGPTLHTCGDLDFLGYRECG